MRSMAIDRRQFLIGATVLLGTARGALWPAHGASTPARDAAAFAGSATYASAARRADGSYAVLLLGEDGSILREIPLSARAHDVTVDPATGRAVVFARRPGAFALAFDVAGARPPELFAPPPDRHFYGHGVFARDGRLVYATEHDVDTGDGVIGVYDANGGWRRVGEFPSYGIGPHELILLADGRTLAIANGGFGSDPATGRESIDIAGMEPNLAFVDVATGALAARHGLPAEINLLSLRHLAADARGQVWFGGQWQGGLEDAPALIGCASLEKPIALLDQEASAGMALRGYIGSVAVSAGGRLIAASAPRAGRIVYVDTSTRNVVHEVALADGCGVAAHGAAAFAISSGHGDVRFEAAGDAAPREQRFPGTEFDNHLRRL